MVTSSLGTSLNWPGTFTLGMNFTPPTMNSNDLHTSHYINVLHKSQLGIPDHLSKSNCAILRPCSSGSLQFPSKHNLPTSNFRLLAICNTVMTGVTRSSSHLSARPQCVRSYRKVFKVNHSCGKISLTRHALSLVDQSHLVRLVSSNVKFTRDFQAASYCSKPWITYYLSDWLRY